MIPFRELDPRKHLRWCRSPLKHGFQYIAQKSSRIDSSIHSLPPTETQKSTKRRLAGEDSGVPL